MVQHIIHLPQLKTRPLQVLNVLFVHFIPKPVFVDTMNGRFSHLELIYFRLIFLSLYSCHRTHTRPDITNTLLAVNMYSNFEMQYGLDTEYDFGR